MSRLAAGVRRTAAAVATAAAVGGCTVASGPDEIAIEHFAAYVGVATMLAEQHCAKVGKQARLVQLGPQETFDAIPLGKRVSVYHCVDAAGGAKAKP